MANLDATTNSAKAAITQLEELKDRVSTYPNEMPFAEFYKSLWDWKMHMVKLAWVYKMSKDSAGEGKEELDKLISGAEKTVFEITRKLIEDNKSNVPLLEERYDQRVSRTRAIAGAGMALVVVTFIISGFLSLTSQVQGIGIMKTVLGSLEGSILPTAAVSILFLIIGLISFFAETRALWAKKTYEEMKKVYESVKNPTPEQMQMSMGFNFPPAQKKE